MMNVNAIKGLMELLGADEEQIERIEKISFSLNGEKSNGVEELELDFTDGDVIGNQGKLMNAMKKALWTFENADEVEIDVDILDTDKIDAMWHNMDVFSYDIENFFLEKFVFYVKSGNTLKYKMFFSIEDGNIFLFINHINNGEEEEFCCGTVMVLNGKFFPLGAISENYYHFMAMKHREANMRFDREFLANRTLMNSLLYIIVTNQIVNLNREVVTETTRRIELPTKKKNKQKNQTKKTKQVRYIKVDSEKVKCVRDEYERVERGSYQRHLSEWSRRGYWMTTRSGEKKWIKPTTCYAKEKTGEKIQKLYKIK